MIAIGGAEEQVKDQVILQRFVRQAGGSDARIVVIPTASRLHDTGAHYCALFRDLGAADAQELALERRPDCGLPRAAHLLRQATGVFLTGGNQLRLSSVIGGTEVAYVLRERNANGAVIAGTSAGAAYISEHMIAYGQVGPSPRAGMVSVVPGLGLINGVIIDQHFRQRDRLGRLLTALAYNPFAVGLGIDEDTAAAFGADGVLRVVGAGAVTVVDGAGLTHDGMGLVREGEPVCLIGLQVHVLVHGGSYGLTSRRAYPAEESTWDVPEERLRAADRDVQGMPRRRQRSRRSAGARDEGQPARRGSSPGSDEATA